MGKSVIGNLFDKAREEENALKANTNNGNTVAEGTVEFTLDGPQGEKVERKPRNTGAKKMGRPSKRTVEIPASESVYIRCKVSTEENRKIKAYCVANDLTVDELIRRTIFKVVK